MKAILKFDLSKEQDREAYETTIYAYKYKFIIESIMANDDLPYKSVEEIQNFIKENLNGY